MLNNYQADTGWGGVMGEPSKEQLKLWEALKWIQSSIVY